jgi:5-methylcytosine-specific restriction protein A
MRVSDLPRPVQAAKADWLPGDTYLGFTPREVGPGSYAACQSQIQRQFRGGYVLEYVTRKFDNPNSGFENDPRIIAEREEHSRRAGRLVAIHALRPSARQLREIVGDEEYELLQDMWANGADRRRWSVAFPIVESWEIDGWPDARAVFGRDAYRRLFAHPSGALRPLNDDERALLGGLRLTRRTAPNAWFAIEDEMRMADASDIEPRLSRDIFRDLAANALEGHSEEQRARIRKRAGWLAQRFVNDRAKLGTLYCDACGFNPNEFLPASSYRLRSTLDVHHKNPLAEGVRWTTGADYALLCPTCHRLEHILLRRGQSFFLGD